MGSLWQRGLLAAALGLGVTAGLARAGDPVVSQPAGSFPQAESLTPVPAAGLAGSCPVHEHPGQVKRPFLERLRPRNLGQAVAARLPLTCYGHHNDYACGSIHAETVFLFGSCRQFYGERCLKHPPASPVPGFDPYNLTYNPPGSPGYVPDPSPSNCRCR